MKNNLYIGRYAPKCTGNPNVVTVRSIKNNHKVNKNMKKTTSKSTKRSTKSATKLKFTINNFSITLHENEVTLKQYILDRKNQRVGIVVGFTANIGNGPKKTYVGWSKCNVDSGDKFDKTTAIKIAVERAVFGTVNGKAVSVDIPCSIANTVLKMEDRVKRYFKSVTNSSVKLTPESAPKLHRFGDVYKWEGNNQNYRFVMESHPYRARFILENRGMLIVSCGNDTIPDNGFIFKDGFYHVTDNTFKNLCKEAGFTGKMQKV